MLPQVTVDGYAAVHATVADMGSTSGFPMADRVMHGGLAAFLKEQRAADESFETICFRLRADHDIVVSTNTVRRWVALLAESADGEAIAL